MVGKVEIGFRRVVGSVLVDRVTQGAGVIIGVMCRCWVLATGGFP